jgi:hypothetical protein
LGKKLSLAVFSMGAFLGISPAGLAGNPFITSIYTADPSAHVWSDGRLYVYHNCFPFPEGTLRSICVDLLNFDTNGNILKAVQTTNGVPSVGGAPGSNPNTLKYTVASATAGNGASVVSNRAASSGQCMHNLQRPGAFMKFDAVDGGAAGGRATLDIRYTAAGTAKLRVIVNGEDGSFINIISTGGWANYTGDSSLTVTLKPGKENVVEFIGGAGGVDVDYMTVTPLPPGP